MRIILTLGWLVCVGTVFCAAPVLAQTGDVQAAARAFEEGQRAQLQQQYARAAQFFEIAHRAAPAPAAIRAAIRNHRAAGALPRAATLSLEASSDYAEDAETLALARSVLEEAGRTLGQVEVTCAAPCAVSIDGRLATLEAAESIRVFVAPGDHEINARFGEVDAPPQSWTATAGQSGAVSFDAPVADPDPDPTEPDPSDGQNVQADPEDGNSSFRRDPVQLERTSASGLSPAVTWVGIGATAVVGAVFVWSLVDVGNASDNYHSNPTRDGFEEGQDKVRRMAILGATTGVLGVATLLIATLGTRWEGQDAAHPAADTRASVWVGQDGGGLVVSGSIGRTQ